MQKQEILESTRPEIIEKRFRIVRSLLILSQNDVEITIQWICDLSKTSRSTVITFLKILEKMKIVEHEYIPSQPCPALPHVGGGFTGFNSYFLTTKMKDYFSQQADLWEKDPTHNVLLLKKIRNYVNPDPQIKKMFNACEIGDLNTVKEIIVDGFDTNTKDKDELTALFFATEKHHIKVIELLVSNKADFNYYYTFNNKSRFYGKSPYTLAIEEYDKKIVKFFLKKGADVHKAFEKAVKRNDIKFFDYLLSIKNNLDPKYLGYLLCLYHENENPIKLLNHILSMGADIYSKHENVRDTYEDIPQSALHWAFSNGKTKLIDLFLSNKNNMSKLPKFIKIYADNLLGNAISNNREKIVEKLIMYRINVNERFFAGTYDTPLEMAVAESKPNFRIIKMLIDAGASTKNKKYIVTPSPLELAVFQNKPNLENIKKIIDNKGNLNKINEQKNASILVSRDNKDEKYYLNLIKKKTYYSVVDGSKKMLLHIAAQNGYLKIIEYLIKNKININQQDKRWGYTPLHYAAINNHYNILELLIKNGAQINIKDNKNCTSIDLARELGRKEITEFLKKSLEGQMIIKKSKKTNKKNETRKK